MEVTLKPDS